MKTREIRNLKTSKTEKQIQDEILSLKSKKRVQLANTDWTQLDDVPLKNAEEFRGWRKSLRDLEITSLTDGVKLEEIISARPVPELGEFPDEEILESESDFDELHVEIPVQEYSEVDFTEFMDALDDVVVEEPEPPVIETREEAVAELEKKLIAEKGEELKSSDASSYALFRLLQEELIEYDLGDAPPKFLERYMEFLELNPFATEDLKEVEGICKDFFKRINDIFFKFEQKIRSVYTMSDEELTKELGERGYRYRPSE